MTLTIALSSSSDASDATFCIHLFAFPKGKLQTVGKLKFWLKERPWSKLYKPSTPTPWSMLLQVKRIRINQGNGVL